MIKRSLGGRLGKDARRLAQAPFSQATKARQHAPASLAKTHQNRRPLPFHKAIIARCSLGHSRHAVIPRATFITIRLAQRP